MVTHFHHDHFTPFEGRRWESSDEAGAHALYRGKPVFAKSARRNANFNQARRGETLLRRAGLDVREA